MEFPSQEAEIPIPLNSTCGRGHDHTHAHTHAHHLNMMHHHQNHPPSSHNHIIIPSPPPQITPPSGPTHISSSTHDHDDNNDNSDDDDDDDDVHDHTTNNNHSIAIVPFKKPVKYKECLKNHAASIGGNATDGCGEFMPSGDEGTLEALTCSACNCHRNFHRKETENGPTDNNSKKLYLGYHHQISSRAHQYVPPHHPMIMSYGGGGGGSLPSESDERPAKKRFRTKFSQDQKDKMLRFAEKVGWKMQKQEESVVQQFCQEVGVKRRVLKVWMHNNKHNLAANKGLIQQQNPNINNSNSDYNHV